MSKQKTAKKTCGDCRRCEQAGGLLGFCHKYNMVVGIGDPAPKGCCVPKE
jgi:hypothetical protein